MKKIIYNVVCSTCNTYDQVLFNRSSKIKLTPEEVVEYLTKEYNSVADTYTTKDQRKNYELGLTTEDLEKLAVGKSIDEDFIPEMEDCDRLFSWTVYKMAVEITFPLDGRDKLEEGINIKFTDDKEAK